MTLIRVDANDFGTMYRSCLTFMTINSKKILIYPLLLLLFALTSCGNSNSTSNSNDGSQENSNNNASYTITFEANWNNGNFATNFPPGPHFSGLIGSTHNASQVFFSSQTLASSGIQSVAETGSKSQFITEINNATNTTQHLLNGSGISSGIGTTNIDFNISQAFSQVTLISMIAPSPDWFVGVRNLDLYDKTQNQWRPVVKIALKVYDAGTDDGDIFTSGNVASIPHVSITLLTNNPVDTDFNQGVHRTTGATIATFTFVLR